MAYKFQPGDKAIINTDYYLAAGIQKGQEVTIDHYYKYEHYRIKKDNGMVFVICTKHLSKKPNIQKQNMKYTKDNILGIKFKSKYGNNLTIIYIISEVSTLTNTVYYNWYYNGKNNEGSSSIQEVVNWFNEGVWIEVKDETNAKYNKDNILGIKFYSLDSTKLYTIKQSSIDNEVVLVEWKNMEGDIRSIGYSKSDVVGYLNNGTWIEVKEETTKTNINMKAKKIITTPVESDTILSSDLKVGKHFVFGTLKQEEYEVDSKKSVAMLTPSLELNGKVHFTNLNGFTQNSPYESYEKAIKRLGAWDWYAFDSLAEGLAFVAEYMKD